MAKMTKKQLLGEIGYCITTCIILFNMYENERAMNQFDKAREFHHELIKNFRNVELFSVLFKKDVRKKCEDPDEAERIINYFLV